MDSIEFIRKSVKSHLPEKRYKHTLGVVEFSCELAKHYNICEEKTEIAALLHDYCKYYSNKDILEFYKERNISIHEVILNNPNLAHGFIGSEIIKEKFKILDKDIINAIANHTFGRKNMSFLEKIIYVSDSIEPGRNFDGVEELRKLSFKNLDKTILRVCESTLCYEIRRNHLIHPYSIEMRNELILKITTRNS